MFIGTLKYWIALFLLYYRTAWYKHLLVKARNVLEELHSTSSISRVNLLDIEYVLLYIFGYFVLTRTVSAHESLIERQSRRVRCSMSGQLRASERIAESFTFQQPLRPILRANMPHRSAMHSATRSYESARRGCRGIRGGAAPETAN